MNKNEATFAKARFWQVAGLSLLLAALTFAVFSRTLSFPFVDYDDNAYVYDNPVVPHGLTIKNVAWAFHGVHANNWHPLTWLSHMLDCQLYGLNPAGHHLTNLLLHIATAVVLFLVLRQMTGALWPGFFVALIFAIHPLRVESVAWVAERKDVLSGLFFLLTLGAYVQFAQRPSRSWMRYGLALFLFALALMCKPTVITLPVVLLLLDYWPLQRKQSLGKLVMEKLPFFALSAAACAITLAAQREAIQTSELFSLPLRAANALVSCVIYLRQMVFPTGLAVFYPYPRHGLPGLEIVLAALLIASVTVTVLWQRQRQPWLLVGWFWYLVMLLPMLGIIQAGNQAHADRYTYLPQIGICVALAWSLAKWAKEHRSGRPMAVLSMIVIAEALSICAWRQTAWWQNSETLWRRALSCTTANDLAHFGLGNVYLKQGKFEDAISEFQTAAKIRPDYAEAHNNIGFTLFKEGKADAAIPEYQAALQIQPGYADPYFGLGNVFLQKEQWDKAAAFYKKSLQLQPDNATVEGDLGIALFQPSHIDEALSHFQTALQLTPDDPEAQFNLGNALCKLGNVDQAIPYLQMALRTKPDFAQAHLSLGIALEKEKKWSDATRQFTEAFRLDPSNATVKNKLAWLLSTCPEAALRDGRRALQLALQASGEANGKNPILLRTLAAAEAETGDFSAAQQSAREAVVIVRAAGREDMAKTLLDDIKSYEARAPLRL